MLYVIQHRDYSGAETSQEVVIRSDPDALVACPEDSPSEEFARALGADTVSISFHTLRHSGGAIETGRSILRGLRGAIELRRVLRRHPEREVVYGIGIRSGLLAALASVGLHRRVVWSVTDLLPPWPLRPLVRLTARFRAQRSICLSEFIAEDLIGASHRLRERTTVVNPGVELGRFAPSGTAGATRAGIVGHISHVKRTDLAIDIAGRVAAADPEFQLKVIGAAQFRDESFELERALQARVAADPSLGRAVEFAGRQGDVVAALGDCGLLLHCRPDEPFGMVMVEAMALGLPVVAPAAGGPLEIVEDGESGLLFVPGDASDAAQKVLTLLRDRELAARMGAAGRERAERRFGAALQLERTRELLGGPPARAGSGVGSLP